MEILEGVRANVQDEVELGARANDVLAVEVA